MNELILRAELLEEIHPRLSFLTILPLMILRLTPDPICMPQGIHQRTLQVSHRGILIEREITWNDHPNYSTAEQERLANTIPEGDITAHAAVGIMAILVYSLEGMELDSVLRIGSGGDYLATVPGENRPMVQVECSGIYRDETPTGSRARQRLREKGQQVLTRSPVGFASVTTFSHGPNQQLHSYLHYFPEPRTDNIPSTTPRKRRR